jgi:pimeloyl-ACP methyl ester carboxylesterase
LPTVDANGITINYTVEGAGPPLIMLHGATSAPLEDWAAQRPAFRQAFRLYLPDARGHAATRWDARQGLTSDMLVDDLLGFADGLGLTTFHLIGFSMGAMTALTFATRHPERLRTAIICGIDIAREPRTRVAWRLMDPDRILREEPAWAEQLERRHGPVQGPGAWQHLLRAIAEDVGTQPLLTPEELRRARLPIQLVYGDRDVFVPADHAVAIYRQLPDARLFIAPDSPHQVMVSQPHLFNQAAAAFYRSTEQIARRRAGAKSTGQELVASGAAVLNPVAAHEDRPADDVADPFSLW